MVQVHYWPQEGWAITLSGIMRDYGQTRALRKNLKFRINEVLGEEF